MNYDNVNLTEDYLWSILYLTGYLTQAWPEAGEIADGMMGLQIPNEEVKTIFADTVKGWFTDTIEAKDRREFLRNGGTAKLTN